MNCDSFDPNSIFRQVSRRVFRQSAAVLAITLFCLLSTTAHAEKAQGKKASTLGLVKTKPASGPFVETKQGFMVPYKTTIPGTDITFEMVPIRGGKYMMGSPATEKDRNADEGPQTQVVVEPFWMGKYEVTWSEYKLFMDLYDVFKDITALRSTLTPVKDNDPEKEKRTKQRLELLDILKKHPELKARLAQTDKKVDALTAPTKLYDPSSTFESGEDPRQPAVTMTQYAAKQYTKWLSYLSGNVYRLPAEAEWEYACRAGTTTAYYFGDDAKKIDEHGWYYDNADDVTHVVGELKPNPWGLYDMHGNAAEWVLDEYNKEGYKKSDGKALTVAQSVVWPTKVDPRVVRGGHWDDDVEALRSAARLSSNVKDWKAEDPNLPLSPWWFTSSPATGVGFRLLRPLSEPTKEEKNKFWDIQVDFVQGDVDDRLKEGRGAEGVVDTNLPKSIEAINTIKKGRQIRKPEKHPDDE